MKLDEFQAHVKTSGRAAYADFGAGRPALFLHGVGSNGSLWRNVIGLLRDDGGRRCIALDLPLHGSTPATSDDDFTLHGLAEYVEGFCESLGLTGIDLVANDSGGAVAQVFAAKYPERLRTLTLTNCDTKNNIPPEEFRGTVEAAAAGQLAALSASPDLAELARGVLSTSYEHIEKVDAEVLRGFFEPVLGTMELGRQFERFLVEAIRPDDLADIEPLLAKTTVPTLIAWGDGDDFFPLSDAHWLRDLIPGVVEVVEIDGARLFFVDERAEDLVPHLRRHWAAY